MTRIQEFLKNLSKTIALILPILLFGCLSLSAQINQAPKLQKEEPGQACSLKLKDAPAVRGIRLGMLKAELQKIYPAMRITAGGSVSGSTIFGSQITNPEYQKNIDRITVAFNGDKVESILLLYDNSVVWDSVEEFANKISASLNVPRLTLKKQGVGGSGSYYSINCEDFTIRARINGDRQPILFLSKASDEFWQSTQEKKDAFKP